MADHSGHRERVKAEFLARGIEGWSSHRVLELLLFYAIPQKDTNGLAHELIERFGSLAGVLAAQGQGGERPHSGAAQADSRPVQPV